MQLWVWFLFNPAWCFQANPHNYDAWFDYLRLVESDAEAETVREVYERAIANVPPVQEKRHWKRYLYLWINDALYEELEAKVQSGSWLRGAAPRAAGWHGWELVPRSLDHTGISLHILTGLLAAVYILSATF